MEKTELYISFDVETDGPTPMINNLLQIGLCGLLKDGTEIFSKEYNIKPLPNHIPDKDTLDFWLNNEKAWNFIHENQVDYRDAFLDLSNKLFELSNLYNFVFVAWPSCFDWMFFKSYYEMARIENKTMYDIGFKCTCASTIDKLHKLVNLQNHKLLNKNKNLCDIASFDKNIIHTGLYDSRLQGHSFLQSMKMFESIKK
jgi:DNA polymerase III alpha subunit (gram-positive type)